MKIALVLKVTALLLGSRCGRFGVVLAIAEALGENIVYFIAPTGLIYRGVHGNELIQHVNDMLGDASLLTTAYVAEHVIEMKKLSKNGDQSVTFDLRRDSFI